MSKLYDISVEKENLFKEIDAVDGEITEEVEGAMALLEKKEEQALIIAKQYVEQKEDFVRIAKSRAMYYSEIARGIQKKIDNTKAYILQYMLENDIACVKNGIEEVSIATNPPSVDIIDECAIPESMVWHTVKMSNEQYTLLKIGCAMVKIEAPDSTPSINKKKIHELYKQGIETTGTQIIQKKRLKMR